MKRLCGEAKGNALFVTNVQDRIDYHTISCTSSSVYLTMLLMWLRRLDERGGRRPQYQPRHQRGVEGHSLPSDQVASDFPYTLVSFCIPALSSLVPLLHRTCSSFPVVLCLLARRLVRSSSRDRLD